MKQMFLSTATEFKEIETFEPGAWINLVNPSQEESLQIAERFNIDITDLRAPLDVEETSRVSVEDDYTLIIVDVPTPEERNSRSYFITIPLGIIVTETAVITTCLESLTLFDNFWSHRIRNFYTFMKTRFVFQLLYRNAGLYLTALRSIDHFGGLLGTRRHDQCAVAENEGCEHQQSEENIRQHTAVLLEEKLSFVHCPSEKVGLMAGDRIVTVDVRCKRLP